MNLKHFIVIFIVALFASSADATEFQMNWDMNMLENNIHNGTQINATQFFQDGNLVIDTSTSFTDTNTSTECSSGEYLDGGGSCINFNDTVDAQDVIYNTTQTTYTDAQDVIYNTTMTTYVNAEDIVYNTTMTGYVDAQNVVYNTSQTNYANALNVSMTAFVNAMDVIYNTTMTTYVNLMNATMTTYVDAQDVIYNTTMTAYADLHCALTGCTMSGNIAMGNNDITGATWLNSTNIAATNGYFTNLYGLSDINLENNLDGTGYTITGGTFTDGTGTITGGDGTGWDDWNVTELYQNGNKVLDTSDESSLDVNRSDYWDDINTPDDFVNIIASGNLTVSGSIKGQPITGAIGSGIINCSENLAHCGCMNVTVNQDLEIRHPEFTARVIDTDGTLIDCYKAAADMNITDDLHSTYYLNLTCDWNSESFSTFHGTDMSPGGRVRIFDVLAINGIIEETKGNTLLSLAKDKTEQVRIFCSSSSHLSVCSGFDITTDTFPAFNVSSGYSVYLNTYLPSDAKSTLADESHHTHHTNGDWVHTNVTGLNITHCDNSTDLVECTGASYRQYPVYSLSWNSDAKIHQLAPLTTGTTYANLAACKEGTPDYVLPASEDYVAIVHHIYCAKRTDSSWVADAWVDLRIEPVGAGGTQDLSIYLSDYDFPSAGLMKTDGAGSYSSITDSSTNWDSAYTWANANHTNWDNAYLYSSVWNKTYADTLYAATGYGDDWNKTYADTLYADVSIDGTVTSIATTAPIAGGTITTTGTISLAPCADTQGLLYNDTSSAWECETIAGSGDITGVTTDGSYLTGGCLSGTCDLLANETYLNATISDLDTDTTYTFAKDLVGTAPVTINGGTNVDNIIYGADADVTIAVTLLKDLVAGDGLNGGANDVLVGADADVTFTFDCSEVAGLGLACDGEDLIQNDSSSQASSDNSARTYIQDILLDTYGHVTSITTAAETEVKLTEEEVEDFVGGMLAGLESLISVVYDDTAGMINFTVESDLHLYSWTNVVDADITNTLTCSDLVAGAAVDIGAYDLRALSFTSDIATGTAPLVVASTTVVANLNATTAVNAYDLSCTDCIDGTEIAELADGDISNTLTVTGYMQDEDINSFSEIQAWVTDATLVKAGTLTDTKICIYDSANSLINCTHTDADSGDVTTVGTPVDNQVGIWTGDGTLEGVTTMTYTATTGLSLDTDNTDSATNVGLLKGIVDENVGAGTNSGIFITNNNAGGYNWAATDYPSGTGVHIYQGAAGTALSIYGANNVNTAALANFGVTDTQSGASKLIRVDIGAANQAMEGIQVVGNTANAGAISFHAAMETNFVGDFFKGSVNSVEKFAVDKDGDALFNALNLTSNLNIIQNKICYDATCAAYEYFNGTCFIRYIGGSTLNHCPP